MHRFGNAFILLLSLFLLPATSSNLRGQEFNLSELQTKVQDVIEKVRPAVVRISGGGSVFSGVIVSPEGHVLSAAHAVRPGARYQITLPSGKRLRGTGKGSNSRTDAALILISQPGDDLVHAPMGESSSLVRNQPVLGISFPGGQKAGSEPVIRFGHLVSTNRNRNRGMLQSTALMEPGDSGGPLFDLNGSVIGIHSRIGNAMERNYEVPVDVYRKFWNELNREASFTRAGPPSPKLGVRCESLRGKGLQVVRVFNGLGSKAGIKEDDLLVSFGGSKVDSFDKLRSALIRAGEDKVETVKVVVERRGEEVELDIVFDPIDEQQEYPLPKDDHPDVPKPRGFAELKSLAKQLADLESKLDDACVEIVSDRGDGQTSSIPGIRIRETPWVVSKSSVVGSKPRIGDQASSPSLTIVKRDKANDLVLLKAEKNHEVGIDLDAKVVSPSVGTFLLSPDADGWGTVSLVSTPAFRSRKQQSGGFLGVTPSTFRRNEGVRIDRVVSKGAAERAGILVGDVITKLDETLIRSDRELRSVLSQADPNATIVATLRRDEDELKKSIVLGARPSNSNHTADRMDKSGRRDGFPEVLSHDADLEPEECGGPLFDLKGNFVGLNIARNSRVRCYALPATTLLEFVRGADLEPSDESQ